MLNVRGRNERVIHKEVNGNPQHVVIPLVGIRQKTYSQTIKMLEVDMIAQKMMTTNETMQNHEMAVQEAMRLLSRRPIVQRWICEVCGMIHTEVVPAACDSCGATSFVPQTDIHLEMHSRC
jgi:rubrerythrin